MSYNQVRFQLDPTGNNSDNRITGEIKTLSDKSVRAVTPTYGPFFADRDKLQIYDHVTNQLLSRGQDYQITELNKEATVRYGKEIASVILIINQAVHTTIRINYQILGGHFTNDATAIAELYETVIKDNRPVLWENVLNKPLEYPPSLHRHLLEDLYGFEPIVDMLERIHNAILLNNIPLIEAYFDWIQSLLGGLKCHEIDLVIPNKKVVTYDALLAVLTKFNVISKYSIKNPTYVPKQGQTFKVTVVSKDGVSDTSILHWFIFTYENHLTPITPLFNTVTLKGGEADIYIHIPADIPKSTKKFIIGIKDNLGRVDFIAVSCEYEAFVYTDLQAETLEISEFANDMYHEKPINNGLMQINSIC